MNDIDLSEFKTPEGMKGYTMEALEEGLRKYWGHILISADEKIPTISIGYLDHQIKLYHSGNRIN